MKTGAFDPTVFARSRPNSVSSRTELIAREFIPEHTLMIGEDGLGNFYYIRLDENSRMIRLSHHRDPVCKDGNDQFIDGHASSQVAFNNLNEMTAYLKMTLGA